MTAATFHFYPCDRGTGTPVGYHHFQLTAGSRVPVCIFCGKVAPQAVPSSSAEEDD